MSQRALRKADDRHKKSHHHSSKQWSDSLTDNLKRQEFKGGNHTSTTVIPRLSTHPEESRVLTPKKNTKNSTVSSELTKNNNKTHLTKSATPYSKQTTEQSSHKMKNIQQTTEQLPPKKKKIQEKPEEPPKKKNIQQTTEQPPNNRQIEQTTENYHSHHKKIQKTTESLLLGDNSEALGLVEVTPTAGPLVTESLLDFNFGANAGEVGSEREFAVYKDYLPLFPNMPHIGSQDEPVNTGWGFAEAPKEVQLADIEEIQNSEIDLDPLQLYVRATTPKTDFYKQTNLEDPNIGYPLQIEPQLDLQHQGHKNRTQITTESSRNKNTQKFPIEKPVFSFQLKLPSNDSNGFDIGQVSKPQNSGTAKPNIAGINLDELFNVDGQSITLKPLSKDFRITKNITLSMDDIERLLKVLTNYDEDDSLLQGLNTNLKNNKRKGKTIKKTRTLFFENPKTSTKTSKALIKPTNNGNKNKKTKIDRVAFANSEDFLQWKDLKKGKKLATRQKEKSRMNMNFKSQIFDPDVSSRFKIVPLSEYCRPNSKYGNFNLYVLKSKDDVEASLPKKSKVNKKLETYYDRWLEEQGITTQTSPTESSVKITKITAKPRGKEKKSQTIKKGKSMSKSLKKLKKNKG